MSSMMAAWDRVYNDPKVLREALKHYYTIVAQAETKPSSAPLFTALATDLRKAMESLDADEQQCIMLNCVLGYPGHEVSSRMEISQQKVQQTVRRALDKMVEQLSDAAD